MTDDLVALRDALAAARRRQRFYPADLRDQALAAAHSLGACSLVAKQPGLPPATLSSWRKTPAPSSPSFLPVVVRHAALTPTSHALLLPGGARVDGLSRDDLASLCRKIASRPRPALAGVSSSIASRSICASTTRPSVASSPSRLGATCSTATSLCLWAVGASGSRRCGGAAPACACSWS